MMVLLLAAIIAPPCSPRETHPQFPPDISGACNWGVVTQRQRDFRIDGNPQWVATGKIRPDGKLLVIWVHVSDGRIAAGLYTLGKDGSIRGRWGWADDVQLDRHVSGSDHVETLRNSLDADP